MNSISHRYHLKDLSGEENCRATCTATNELICFLPNKQFISFVSNGDKGLWVKVQLEETFDNVTIIRKWRRQFQTLISSCLFPQYSQQ